MRRSMARVAPILGGFDRRWWYGPSVRTGRFNPRRLVRDATLRGGSRRVGRCSDRADRSSVFVGVFVATLVGATATLQAGGPPLERSTSPYPPSPEATRFFEQLVERYRAIIHYADSFLLEQVVGSADGDERSAVRTRVAARSRVDGERLEVATETDRLWDGVTGTGGDTDGAAVGRPTESIEPADRARRALRRERDLSLAPHLRLRFLDEPLREFQTSGDEAFRATGIASVRHADRDMVRIELRSGGDSPGDASSVIGLTVDPGSMLIRKVDGEEQWSDGRSRTTTISIEPDAAEVDPELAPEADAAATMPREGERPAATPDADLPATTIGLG